MKVATSVKQALDNKKAVVALESSVISQGLAYPKNLEIALALEDCIRKQNVQPSTLAVIDGLITVGCTIDEIKRLATQEGVLKAGSREIGTVVALKNTAALTVSGSLKVASKAGIRVFATGGIGGVHHNADDKPLDVSSDLLELSRNQVVVVCAGAKNILNLGATLEVLESLAVPVFGFQTDEFPAFFVRFSGFKIPSIRNVQEIAAIAVEHWKYSNSAILLCLPVENSFAISPEVWSEVLEKAIQKSLANKISGQASTPYLLREVADFTQGATVLANEKLLLANSTLAAKVALEFEKMLVQS